VSSKIRSSRNKTLVITEEEIIFYSKKLLYPQELLHIYDIKNKIICGDIIDIIKYLPKDFIDLLIIDPPYNLTKNYHGNNFLKKSNDKYLDFVESWFVRLLPCLKDNASIYVCCDWKSSNIIYQVLDKYLIIQNRITWQREKGRGAKDNWKNGLEDIWFATVSKKYYFNVEAVKIKRKVLAPYKENGQPKGWTKTQEGIFRETYPSNFWDDISIPYWSMSENTDHPTQKSEKLLAKLILASSKEGDFIFDPFLGSGTTVAVAKKLNRLYSGVEQNHEYCTWIEKRLAIASDDCRIQGYDGIFWERNSQPKKSIYKD